MSVLTLNAIDEIEKHTQLNTDKLEVKIKDQKMLVHFF